MSQKQIYSIKLYGVKEENGELEIFQCRKVGDALDTDSRLKQHQNAVTQRFENMVDLTLPDGWRDYQVHQVLKKDPKITWDGEAQEGYFTGREVFYMADPDDDITYIDQLVSKIASGSIDLYARDEAYTPDIKQNEAITWAVSQFATKDRLLIEAVPRFGKSFVSMMIGKQLKAHTLLLLTPFPDADGSFLEVAEKHTSFPDAMFIDARDGLDFDIIDENPGMVVIKASWQFLDGGKEKCKGLFNRGVDFIVVDETHRASDTVRSEDYLSRIPHSKELHLSGTPYNDKLAGRFVEDEIWTYDLIDMLLDAEEARKTPGLNPRLAKTPRPSMHLLDGMDIATTTLRNMYPDFEEPENFNLEKFGQNEQWVEIMLRNLALTQADPLAERLMNDKKLKGTLNHILVFVDSREVADVYVRALKTLTGEGGGWGGYHVASVSGIEETENFRSVETYINDIHNTYSKSIIISVGRATTGVTLPKLSSVWIMRAMRSAEQFIQAMMRAGTPYTGKTDISILVFDTESALIAQAMIAQQRARETEESVHAAMEILYRCLPTFVWTEKFVFEQIEVAEAMDFTREIITRKISVDIDIDDWDEALFEELLSMDLPDSFKQIEKQLGKGGQGGAKTRRRIRQRDEDEDDQEEENDPRVNNALKVRVQYIFEQMGWVVAGCDVKNVMDLRAIDNEDSVRYLGVSANQLDAIIDIVGAPKVQSVLDRILFSLAA